MDSVLKRFAEGTGLSDLDEDELRAEARRMVLALEVSERRLGRIMNAIKQVAELCDSESRKFTENVRTMGAGRLMGLGVVEGLNNVASALGHARSWAMRSTREPE